MVYFLPFLTDKIGDKSLNKRNTIVRNAYALVGRLASHYDGMMQNESLLGRFAIRFLWQLDGEKYEAFLRQAFQGLPKDFTGDLLEIPVGTGTLSLPYYKNMKASSITCMDYSEEMLARAREYGKELGLGKIRFQQGDVAALPFEQDSFDCVLSIDGLHAFPQKDASLREIHRVLRKGGTFTGCCYVKGENAITDLFVNYFCATCGFFTPPFDTAGSLEEKLKRLYSETTVTTVGSFAGFLCKK